MNHLVARSRKGRLLFCTWAEGLHLWNAIASQVAGIVHLTLMPDHIHLLHGAAPQRELGIAMRSHARWLNGRRGTAGPLWEPQPEPKPLANPGHHDRTIRYLLLNPCRAGLVADPLAWPLSTHRDAVGLAARPIRRLVADPYRFHEYVSSDMTVAVHGSLLPAGSGDRPTISTVIDATSAIMRRPVLQMNDPSSRGVLIRALRTLCDQPTNALAGAVGVSPRTIRRVEPRMDHTTRLIDRVLGDSRFPGLHHRDLRSGWGPKHWRSR